MRLGLRTAVAAFLCAWVSACASPPPHPAGWTSDGASGWTSGNQRFVITTTPYGGTIKDLVSQETVNAVLHKRSVTQSILYPDCPGLGAILTIVQKRPPLTIEEAFAVGEADATFVTYTRATGTPEDAAAAKAMSAAICRQ
jgi:hypothetical protein